MSGNPDAQRLYNLGQALLEEKKRGPKLCTMCHSKPAEYSGFCGDCYKKPEENKKTRKVANRKFWQFSFFHLFDT
jgi:hypothetical protein